MKIRPLIAFLFICLPGLAAFAQDGAGAVFRNSIVEYGGLLRADTTEQCIYLVFTAGDYNDGGEFIQELLWEKEVEAHFFFTGDFYRDPDNAVLIRTLLEQGHYLGPHSDRHLLYASWENRDSLLVSKEEFTRDLINNYEAMQAHGISREEALFFMPPYEWYNQKIADWTARLGLCLVNFSPGTRSNADYTTPDMGDRYLSSARIYDSITSYESAYGMNGFILLIHLGTHPDRSDKFYHLLPRLIDELRARGYRFQLLNKTIINMASAVPSMVGSLVE